MCSRQGTSALCEASLSINGGRACLHRIQKINNVLSSRAAFYLVTIGAAVGLGSIWRFPYLAGRYGGGLFVATFLVACIVIATPLLVAEFYIGQVSRASPPEAAGVVASRSGRGRGWNAIGAFGTLSAFMVFSYYTMIAGWVVAYALRTASGQLEGLPREVISTKFQTFLQDPWTVGLWHVFFVVLTGTVSSLGLARGIERVSKFRAPAMLILLLILVSYSLWVGDTKQGLSFAFAPRVDTLSGSMLLAAVGQAFYATGVGMAMMIAYGAYIPPRTSLVRAALLIVASIVAVSLMATLVVFPLVFRYHLDPAQGPKLVFEVLPAAFAEMPGGRFVGTAFFVLLALAALTPAIATVEPAIAWLQGRGMPRKLATVAVCVAGWLLGIGSVLSFSLWMDWRPLSFIPGFQTRTFFDGVDFISGDVLLPVGALLTSLFVGWALPRGATANPGDPAAPTVPGWVRVLLRYLCPVAILVVLIGAFV